MARLFTILLFVFIVLQIRAQDVIISGNVIDALSQNALEAVNISIAGNIRKGTISEKDGSFSIEVDSLPVTLVFSSIGFETKKIEVKTEEKLFVQLYKSITELPEIVISSAPKIDTVYDEPYNVVDYLFKDSFLVLLVYKNVFEKYQLVLLDKNEKYLNHLSLKEYQPERLFKSCFNKIYITIGNGAYTIEIIKDKISLGDWVTTEVYDNIIEPCVLYSNNMRFYQRYLYQGQALRYYAFDENKTQDDSLCILPLIEDEANIIRLIEETGNRLPWSGNLWETNISEKLIFLREGPYYMKGAFRMFYPKLYAPLLKKDSSLCLFNHLASSIQFFDMDGQKLREVPISYHKRKRWKKYILYDEFTEQVYTAFHTKWGEYVCKVNMENGSLSEAIPLELDFIEKVRIRNGTMYFLHRNPYQGAANRMIQKVKLN